MKIPGLILALASLFACSFVASAVPNGPRQPATADTIEASAETATGHADVGTIAAGPFQPTWASLSHYECPLQGLLPARRQPAAVPARVVPAHPRVLKIGGAL